MEHGEGPVRILIADEHSLFRQALRVALESQPHLHVVAETQTGCQAAMEARRLHPDVALLSLSLPHCDGVEATLRLQQEAPDCRSLVLAEQEDLETLLEALEAGARGYLSKNSPLHDLIHAVEAIHRGETLIPPWMLGPLLGALIRRRRDDTRALQQAAWLTRREREVLALLARGKDHNGIARELVISPETARTHIQNILSKLGVHSRLEAAAFVSRYGLLGELAEAGS
jgi:DNA-binding NarL/FixJ family response regulator